MSNIWAISRDYLYCDPPKFRTKFSLDYVRPTLLTLQYSAVPMNAAYYSD